ncbi:MAG: hypothetical protein BWY31_03260 [Lentisphaerae bacterium ADurb.Bin242]|nr:MAG: hypothetical protein BWY31_03260 [Lentisphaerae bacterium ADurb.Bin242]
MPEVPEVEEDSSVEYAGGTRGKRQSEKRDPRGFLADAVQQRIPDPHHPEKPCEKPEFRQQREMAVDQCPADHPLRQQKCGRKRPGVAESHTADRIRRGQRQPRAPDHRTVRRRSIPLEASGKTGQRQHDRGGDGDSGDPFPVPNPVQNAEKGSFQGQHKDSGSGEGQHQSGKQQKRQRHGGDPHAPGLPAQNRFP